jgi:acyl-CoA reductase-like NAD-dependent aldehyde dehydrogenase
MARVYRQKTRSERTCGRCRRTIQKGEEYLSCAPGFRSRPQIRCTSCGFRMSEMTTSKMSEAYAAQEDAEDAVNALEYKQPGEGEEVDLASEFQPILEECGQRIRDVAEEYREASSNWAGGERTNDEWEERADELDAAADEVEQWYLDEEYDPESDDTWDEYLDQIKADVVEHINGIMLP